MFSADDQERLARNLGAIRERIEAARAAAGRSEAVELVAVSKYAGPDFARGLLAAGQRDLGENRVDHLLALAAALAEQSPAPRWHMIGHLQRNKAKKVADLLHSLHSLDSLELAQQLDARRSPDLPPLEVYVQVRLDPAEQRSGIEADALEGFVDALSDLTRLRLVGLMGLPPLGEPEDARPHFQRLAALRERLPVAQPKLSMGMTSDLEVAIAEGATCVRVGRALLEGLSAEARA